MNKRNISKIGIVSLFSVCVIGMYTFTSFASDDQKGYSFKLKGGYANSYSEKEYRQTKSPSNPWKVNLAYNEEGDGCIATFWLDVPSSAYLGSDTYDIYQGSGDHYYSANGYASQVDVRLGAENNNDTFWSYRVSGYWDEETW